MRLQIDPHAPLPIYAQIVEQIQDLIMTGRLAVGAELPSVRALASDLEINSLTIQKAYKALEQEGWLSIRKGVGAVVAEGAPRAAAGKGGERLSRDIRQLVSKAKTLAVSRQEVIEGVRHAWEQSE